jgi:DNA-binding NarL/FixJ family response regulator
MSLCTVLLADDYEPFRLLLHSMLEEMAGIQIVGHAADGLEAVQKAKELQPDLILLDIGLPSLNGMQVARHILSSIPHCKVVFLTQETSAEVVEEAFRLGAFGYVEKVHAGTKLMDTLETVRQAKQPA